MSSCPFCTLAPDSAGDDLVAWRTPLAFVLVPTQQRPRHRGHMLVLPRAHVTRLADTDAGLRAELYGVVGRVSLAVRKAFDATGVTVFQNEAAPDQVLHHLHVHVVPRRAGDDFRLPAPEKLVLTLDERIAQARAMRAALA